MSTIEIYVREVVNQIAPGVPARRRIEDDLRLHLEERVAAGEPATEAVARMGDPREVARNYLEAGELPLASKARRFGAFFFDCALAMTFLCALALVFVAASTAIPGSEVQGWEQIPITVSIVGAVFVLGLFYFPVLEAVFGQTVGKKVFGVAVARETGERIGFGTAVLRRLPFLFDFWPLDAGFVFFTKKRQRAFDIVARTIVIDAGNGRRAWMWTVIAWLVAAAVALAVQLVLIRSGSIA